MLRTPLYGSGTGEDKLPEAKPSAPPVATADPISVLNKILFEVPMQFLNSLTQPFRPPAPEGMEPRVTRRHTPHGEVVQEMTTQDLKNRNIFGTGGSQ